MILGQLRIGESPPSSAALDKVQKIRKITFFLLFMCQATPTLLGIPSPSFILWPYGPRLCQDRSPSSVEDWQLVSRIGWQLSNIISVFNLCLQTNSDKKLTEQH